jgi:hypothetical protein
MADKTKAKPRAGRPSPAESLASAAGHVVPADGRKAWNYGWFDHAYRHSPEAALSFSSRTMTIGFEGIGLYEEAVESLLKDPDIRSRWDPEDFWGVVATAVVFIAESDNHSDTATRVVQRLRTARLVLVVFPIANVTWEGPPFVFSSGVVGLLDSNLVACVNSVSAGRRNMEHPAVGSWMSQQVGKKEVGEGEESTDSCPVVAAIWVNGQGMLSFQQAERRFENLLDVALLLETKPSGHGLHMLRGSANRPGPLGDALDRRRLESLFKASRRDDELLVMPLVMSDFGSGGGAYWYSADPIPLSKILAQPLIHANVEYCMGKSNPTTERIKVAARWFAEAHWASQDDDAALALGVALEALIGSPSALPGRAMKERFAFLEADVTVREKRAKRYQDIYDVRCSVAHGRQSSRLSEPRYIQGIAEEVTWAALRMLELQRIFRPANNTALDRVFDGFRWGTQKWPDEPDAIAPPSS